MGSSSRKLGSWSRKLSEFDLNWQIWEILAHENTEWGSDFNDFIMIFRKNAQCSHFSDLGVGNFGIFHCKTIKLADIFICPFEIFINIFGKFECEYSREMSLRGPGSITDHQALVVSSLPKFLKIWTSRWFLNGSLVCFKNPILIYFLVPQTLSSLICEEIWIKPFGCGHQSFFHLYLALSFWQKADLSLPDSYFLRSGRPILFCSWKASRCTQFLRKVKFYPWVQIGVGSLWLQRF